MSQKVASVLLAFLMLLSSSGVTYAQHFCGDHEMMAKFTLGEAHLSCGMAMELPVSDCEDMPEKPSCCDNEYTQVHTDDNFAKSDVQFDLDVSQFALLYSFVFQFETQLLKNVPDAFIDESPPPLDLDRCVLYETFLI